MAKVTVSYTAKLLNIKDDDVKALNDTLAVFNKACTFIYNAVLENWDKIKLKETSNDKTNFVEKLIHKTKQNPSPMYKDFDEKFYKFPSYLRRNAVAECIGSVSSYESNLENYEAKKKEAVSNGRKFRHKKPSLNSRINKFPTLFNKNMFIQDSPDEVSVKLFVNNDWVWKSFKLRKQDIDYTKENCIDLKKSSPTLIKKGENFKLRFAYEKNNKLKKEKSIQERKIVAVDLGINTYATCSVIDGRGTVLGRKFIDFPKEKDRMYRLINRTCRVQKRSGNKAKLKKIWNKINGYKKEITNKVCHEIIKYALENEADTIVFEHLSKNMPKMDDKAKKIRIKVHHWNKRTIINKVCEKAHFYGLRYATVNPKNTSKLAFDGSGEVIRGVKAGFSTNELCRFKNNKVYNCDLSASYNIGARYFIREYYKSISEASTGSSGEKKWLLYSAKVPNIVKRTSFTLADLISYVKVSSAEDADQSLSLTLRE